MHGAVSPFIALWETFRVWYSLQPQKQGRQCFKPLSLDFFSFSYFFFFFKAFLPFLPPLSFLHTCIRPVCSPSQVPASPASVCPCFSLKPAVCISLFSSSPQKKNEVFVGCLLGFVCLPWNTSCAEASLAISCPYSPCNPDAPDRCCIHHISQRGKLLVFLPHASYSCYGMPLRCLSVQQCWSYWILWGWQKKMLLRAALYLLNSVQDVREQFPST